MISNQRPDGFERKPRTRHPYAAPRPYSPEPRPYVQEDTIKAESMLVERKTITVTLKENPRGRFLRIMEETGDRRNSIILPITGLDGFKQILNRMAEANATTPAAEQPGDDIGNR